MKNITRGDADWTTCATINDSTKIGRSNPGGTPYYWILGNYQYSYPNYGNKIQYDLSQSYYTIDGTTTYLALPTSSNIMNVYYYIQVK